MSDFEKLDALRRLPGTWIQLICNSRTPDGDLAWSLTCKYGSGAATRNVQYVSTSLTEVITNLETHLIHQNLAAPAVSPPPKRKLKLKRSTS